MTLGGLALGAGMLVDNAIVVMENIFRNMESGMSLREAAIHGTAQVAGAITASTITTIVVFLPIVYLHGASGELFKDQAWTVAFALLSSLVVAVLVIPMLCDRFLKKTSLPKERTSISFPWYKDLLKKILSKRGWILGGAACLIALAVLLIPVVGSEFIPKIDAGEFTVRIDCQEGTELSRTEQVVLTLEEITQNLLGDDLQTLYSHVGPSTGLGGEEGRILEDENTATMKVILKGKRSLSTQKAITSLSTALADIPDVDVQFVQDQTALQATLGTDEARWLFK